MSTNERRHGNREPVGQMDFKERCYNCSKWRANRRTKLKWVWGYCVLMGCNSKWTHCCQDYQKAWSFPVVVLIGGSRTGKIEPLVQSDTRGERNTSKLKLVRSR